MKQLSEKFYDERSLNKAVEIASEAKIDRVMAAHLFALLNGVPAEELRGAQGKLGKKYYNMLYALYGKEKGSVLDIEGVLEAYNKKFYTNISVEELRSLRFGLDIENEEDCNSFLQLLTFDDTDPETKEKAYNELLEKYETLRSKYVELLRNYKRASAEVDILKIEKRMLEETKAKLIKTFKGQVK